MNCVSIADGEEIFIKSFARAIRSLPLKFIDSKEQKLLTESAEKFFEMLKKFIKVSPTR